jgi:mannose/cellobiose epimerase-like protein (N-acyl-D-glucosamine 2-epimerase family)
LSNDVSYLTRLESTLSWIETKQVDAEYGEWFWGISPDGSVGPRGDHKGEEWKAEYHAVRALVFTADWIDQILSHAAGAPVPAPVVPAAAGTEAQL